MEIAEEWRFHLICERKSCVSLMEAHMATILQAPNSTTHCPDTGGGKVCTMMLCRIARDAPNAQ